MTFAWSGADPTAAVDPGSYSLGVTFTANVAITVTGVRVWADSNAGVRVNRRARLWTTGETQLGIATLPDTLPDGWSEYDLVTPVDLAAGSSATVAWDTGGNYGAINGAFDSAVNSADSAVTFLAAASAPHGNGSFTTSVGAYPDVASSQHTFYGVDIVYTVTGGNQPPTIDTMSVTVNGDTATAAITASDPDTLTGATYSYDWGDGTTTSGSASTAVHTYAAAGFYAVLGSVTNVHDLSAYAARPVDIAAPLPAGLDIGDLVDQLVSHAQSLGVCDRVLDYEPTVAPGDGITAAFWFDSVGPAKGASGMGATTIALNFIGRLYRPLLNPPQSALEHSLVTALSALMGAYSADFDLAGLVRNVDLLGRHGAALSARGAYQSFDTAPYRLITIRLPLIVNDAWPQEA